MQHARQLTSQVQEITEGQRVEHGRELRAPTQHLATKSRAPGLRSGLLRGFDSATVFRGLTDYVLIPSQPNTALAWGTTSNRQLAALSCQGSPAQVSGTEAREEASALWRAPSRSCTLTQILDTAGLQASPAAGLVCRSQPTGGRCHFMTTSCYAMTQIHAFSR